MFNPNLIAHLIEQFWGGRRVGDGVPHQYGLKTSVKYDHD
jgi:hypothetical protein